MMDCSTSDRNHPSASASSRSARALPGIGGRRSTSSAASAASSRSVSSASPPHSRGRVSQTQKLPSTCPSRVATGKPA